MVIEIVLTVSALAVSAAMTGWVRRRALSRGLLDVPNQRSSHSVPTPRGGGAAIVAATTVCLSLLFIFDAIDLALYAALVGGGIAVALVGFADDRRPVRPGVRLAVHFAAALWGMAWLGGLPPVQVGDQVAQTGSLGYALGAIGIVWTLNLFNFMDGIDGIAASEATFIAWAGALLAFVTGATGGVFAAALILGAASFGFLLWNWPPARIFMGDVGSGYLGYMIAVLALGAAREHASALYVWLLLGGVFFVDATVTLIRRLIRREHVHVAHRSHAYQWLSRRWQSHKRVTVLALLVNLIWLLPWAFVAIRFPRHAAWIVAVAFIPVVAGALAGGAGRAEKS